jgi:hypothetical protein
MSTMTGIARSIVAVRFIQSSRYGTSSDMPEICEAFMECGGVLSQGHGRHLSLSSAAYNYFTDVPVNVGDLVVVRGGDKVSLAVVDALVQNGDFRPTRTIVGKLDFGPKFVAVAKEKEKQRVREKLEKRIKHLRDNEEVLAYASRYAAMDTETAQLLAEFTSFEGQKYVG